MKIKRIATPSWLGAMALVVLGASCASLIGLEPAEDDAPSGPTGSTGALGGGGGSTTSGVASSTGGAGDASGSTGGTGGGSGGGGGEGGAAPATAPPSCATTTSGPEPLCGPALISCCDSKVVHGGPFNRLPGFPATVRDFRLDTFEITVSRFRAFVEAGYGTQAHPPSAGDGERAGIPGSGWDEAWTGYLTADTDAFKADLLVRDGPKTWTAEPGTDEEERKPIGNVSWYELFAFCVWDGGFLPTEAEWGYAAAGGAEQRSFPWGDDAANGDFAVYYCESDPPCVRSLSLPVGSRSPTGDGLFGHADLGGNMAEFVLDWYVAPYATLTCNNCAQTEQNASPGRVVRGGSYDEFAERMENTADGRSYGAPGEPYHRLGGRCARDL